MRQVADASMTTGTVRETTARSKYGNRRTWRDGIAFDSASEARRYGELRLMEQAGAITNLTVHKRYPLVVNGQRVAVYEADFDYYQPERARWITEDVKGVRTQVYRLKRALMKACLGIDVTEVEA